jgi:hypothetical protein
MSLTTGKVLTGTQQAVSLHRRNATEDKNKMTEICVMSSMADMHAARSKTSVRGMSVSNRSSVKKWTMITMVPIMTNLTDNILSEGARCRRSQCLFRQLEEGVLALELQTIGDREV